MKRLLTAIFLSCLAGQASAIERYNISGMSCARIQAALQSAGVAILSVPSRNVPGLTLYDRYASGPSACAAQEIARSVSVTAADGSCPVYRCGRPTSGSGRR